MNNKHLDVELEESPFNEWRKPETKTERAPTPFERALMYQNTNSYPQFAPMQSNKPQQPERRSSVAPEQQLNLQKQYDSYFHYNIANIALIVITVIAGLVEIFYVIALSDNDVVCMHVHGKEQKQRECKKDPTDFFTDEQTRRYFIALFVLYLLVAKIVLSILYYAGKYAYGQKNEKIFKILFILYCCLIILSIFAESLLGVLVFAYLAFCAWKIREILKKFEYSHDGSYIAVA